jgi:hypothetical protein
VSKRTQIGISRILPGCVLFSEATAYQERKEEVFSRAARAGVLLEGPTSLAVAGSHGRRRGSRSHRRTGLIGNRGKATGQIRRAEAQAGSELGRFAADTQAAAGHLCHRVTAVPGSSRRRRTRKPNLRALDRFAERETSAAYVLRSDPLASLRHQSRTGTRTNGKR